MRRWARFGVLLLTTAALIVLTYPVWASLIFPSAPPPSPSLGTKVDVLIETPESGGAFASYELFAPMSNADQDEDPTVNFVIENESETPLGAEPPNGVAYVVLRGDAMTWLDSCTTKLGEIPPQKVATAAIPERITKSWTNGSEPYNVYKVTSGYTKCKLPSAYTASANDNRSYFQLPSTTLAYLDSEDAAPQQPNSFCLNVGLYYTSGTIVDFADSPPSTTGTYNNESVPRTYWSRCEPSASEGGEGSTMPFGLAVGITDTTRAAAVNRQLFLAGALAGVLGGLAIELLGSILDRFYVDSTPRPTIDEPEHLVISPNRTLIPDEDSAILSTPARGQDPRPPQVRFNQR